MRAAPPSGPEGPTPPVLETTSLSVGYDTPLITGINLAVHPGQVVSLIGPNGAGKSTILKTLTGQLDPLAGEVQLVGKPLGSLSARQRAQALSVMLTTHPKTDLLTCADVVAMGRHPHTGRLGVLTGADWESVRRAMELVQVWDLRQRDFMQLSDGQRQRVMLARAICQEPKVMLLDEPTNHLDIHYQIELLAILRALAKEQAFALVMAVHELSFARMASDWVLCVRDGGVMAEGTPHEVFVPQVIDALYDLRSGTFDPITGEISLPAPAAGEVDAHA